MYYQRNLPHMLPPGGPLFLTFRLAGSLPAAVIAELQQEFARPENERETEGQSYARQRRYFGAFDAALGAGSHGPTWLAQAEIAEIVKEALHFRAGKEYLLWAYCLMPNHVHVLLTTPEQGEVPFYKTLNSLKARTARKANHLLHRTDAPFWQAETYDHCVRDGAEAQRIVAYILNNPVKAGLVADWTHWPHTYLHPDW